MGAKPMPVSTGLGPEIDRLAMLSPTLLADLRDIKAKGFQIVPSHAGRGSFTDPRAVPSTITIDLEENDTTERVIATLAHELGHATHPPVYDRSSKQAYVDGLLAGEGAAAFNAIRVQRELQTHGTPPAVLPGGDELNRAYDQYLMDGNYDGAIRQMGEVYRTMETSNTGQNYGDYFGASYDRVTAR
jgi:type VI secretion system secreted protein VgrG